MVFWNFDKFLEFCIFYRRFVVYLKYYVVSSLSSCCVAHFCVK